MNKAGKRIAVIFVSLLLILSFALSGCSSSSTGTTKKTITVWFFGDQPKPFQDLVAKFQKQSGINVNVQAIPWANAHDKLLTAVASKSGPDVITMGSSWMPEFAKAGALADLTPYLKDNPNLKPSNFFKGSVETAQYNGKYYGAPWYIDTRVLFYRTDLLKKVGYTQPPKTWDELLDAATKLSKRGKGYYGFNIDPKEQSTAFMFARQNGSNLIENGKTQFNQPAFVDAVTYMDKFIKQGATPKTDLGIDLTQSFGGKSFVPMFISGSWNIQTINTTVPDVKGKWATAVLPKGKDNNKSILGGADLTIFKYSKNKANSAKLLNYLSSEETQLKWLKISTDMPAVSSAWNSNQLKDNPFYKAFGEQAKTAEPLPLVPQFEEMAQGYLKSWEKIYRTGANVQKTLDQYNSSAQQILDNK
ncbi:sugar ABC transporter substrate-binding protein [Sporolactobacillus kofuensis]|uniref:Sugar ABC transporter substrate-binding protein n=1 Tax=Sporolactobacillus kofuensis TaxID=269672 RepID=A0ABW1WBI6_9BACL|nr:sugar ABC transporter substrate-binding protein [Sporolactobacillus kofuensis]MCO7174839.1 sugar ABC transporter substrate-binding protein [Sporolactobacillus kofuensis]